MYKKTEVFPKCPAPAVVRLADYPNFGNLLGEKLVRHFCLYMEDDKIYFQKRNLSQTVANTFTLHGKEAKILRQFRPDAINWSSVMNKYRRPALESNRKNADTRTGFKIESDYLVKAHFTFGQRRVEPGTAHVIQTLNVPLLFYVRPRDDDPHRRGVRDGVRRGFFPYRTLCRYDRCVLEPDTCYRIPPGTVYVLFSTQKNYFRLDCVSESYKIRFPSVDPVENRVRRIPCMYDEPVPTPFIEDDREASPESPDLEILTPRPAEPFARPAAEPAAVATTFYLIPANPPVLERSVVQATEDFLTAYGKLVLRQFPSPFPDDFKPDDAWNPEPLDLSARASVPVAVFTVPDSPMPEESETSTAVFTGSPMPPADSACTAGGDAPVPSDENFRRQLDELYGAGAPILPEETFRDIPIPENGDEQIDVDFGRELDELYSQLMQ